MNPSDPNAIAARLRSRRYDSAEVQELAETIASALSGVFNQQTVRRGLYDNAIANENGGTTFSVTDPSASKKSVSLQHPQLLRKRQMGAIATRTQRRTDILTKTVPAVVTGINGSGDNTEVTLSLIGDIPRVYVDGTTRQNQPGSPNDLFDVEPDLLGGTIVTLPMTGIGFVNSGDAGPSPPVIGQTIHISLTEQNEKRTFWVSRLGKTAPRVINYPVQPEEAAMVNGICCEEDDDGGPGGS